LVYSDYVCWVPRLELSSGYWGKERNEANLIRKTYQLPRKNLLVEVELNLFVGDVYAQLFKRIPFEIFKTKYVQDSNSVIIVSAKQKKGKCVVKHRWSSTRKKEKLI